MTESPYPSPEWEAFFTQYAEVFEVLDRPFKALIVLLLLVFALAIAFSDLGLG